MDNRELTAGFAEAGRGHGYTSVQAEFAAFRDFKVRWCRSYKWAEFEVTDYVRDAPHEVIVGMAETIFQKIDGNEVGYPEAVCDWLTSDAFVDRMQQTYVRRFPGLGETTAGEHRDLEDSRRRLVEAGLLGKDPRLFIGWVNPSRGKSVGHASVLMKVVAMSGLLDREGVSDNLADYCLYSQTAHVSMGFDPEGGRRADEYEELLDLYPGRESAEEELEALGLRI